MKTPSLDIDKNLQISVSGKLERKVIANLLHDVIEFGFIVTGVYDGEEFSETSGIKDSMELIFNLDECRIYIKSSLGKEHNILIVLGNGSVEDIICDWSFSENDEDKFDEFMEQFTENIEKIAS